MDAFFRSDGNALAYVLDDPARFGRGEKDIERFLSRLFIFELVWTICFSKLGLCEADVEMNESPELFLSVFAVVFTIISVMFVRRLLLNHFAAYRFHDNEIGLWLFNRCVGKYPYDRIKEIVICAGATRYGKPADSRGAEKAYVFLLSQRTNTDRSLHYDGAFPLGTKDSDILLEIPLENTDLDALFHCTTAPIVISGRIYDLQRASLEEYVIRYGNRIIVTR